MRVVQEGDRLLVHYAKYFEDGSVESSRGRGPVALTVGIAHPRMPGVGLVLVGMAAGERKTILVPAGQAYGPYLPGRIYRLARTRFEGHPLPPIGQWVRVWDGWNRRRLVKIVAARRNMVVVDANHRRAGQSLVLEVRVVTIEGPGAIPGAGTGLHPAGPGQDYGEDRWRDDGGQG